MIRRPERKIRPEDRSRIVTIGVGLLCCANPDNKVKPDALLLLSDTQGSTEYDSTDQLHKLLVDEELMIFAACADRLERCADLWPVIQREVRQQNKRSHGEFLGSLNRAAFGHRGEYFRYDVLMSKCLLPDNTVLVSQQEMQAEWSTYTPGVAMIVGTFDENGQAHMYCVQPPERDNRGWVESYAFPGHTAIGTGCYNATFWLNYRGQNLGLGVKRSLYHLYEAGKMASRTPTVSNDGLEILLAMYPDSVSINSTIRPKKPFPFEFDVLEKLFEQYGPQNTGPVATLSTSEKLEGQ